MIQFGRVSPFEIYGHDARRLLQPALDRFGTEWSEVFEAIAKENAVLWFAVRDERPIVAVVTRRDHGDIMEIWLCGGEVLPHCLHFIADIEAEAMAYGMTSARITGRKGWDRVLKPLGWRRVGEDLVKELR